MYLANQQESIKSKLYAFDVQDNHYQSVELTSTLRNYKIPIPKYHSFRQISDWSDRYHIQQCAQPQKQQYNNIEQENDEQYRRFAFLLSSKHRKNGQIQSSTSQKKEKLCLSPIRMQFASYRSKSRHKKQAEYLKKNDGQNHNKSFYELNYEPLNKLYRLRTNRKSQEQPQHSEQLPVLFPQPASQSRFPKKERTSSILRLMKRNQQLKQLKRRDTNQTNIFVLPD